MIAGRPTRAAAVPAGLRRWDRWPSCGVRLSAGKHLALESAVAKLDKYHLLILDDIAYASKDQAETSVLFELISARYGTALLTHHRKSYQTA